MSLGYNLGKARAAPFKRMTNPNLELLAATNWAKLAQFIKEEQNFSFDAIVYWTDSTAVLSWVKSSERRHKILIANRISIVLSTLTVLQWRYVPTALNPADDGTRGIPVSNFSSMAQGTRISSEKPRDLARKTKHRTRMSKVLFSSAPD